jgi:serine/threonine-protein kinase
MAVKSVKPVAAHGRLGEPLKPSAEQVREQLDKMLGSGIFIRSVRLCRFLRRTVELTLAGEAGQIKEYALGRDVFDRQQGYDPRIDSIVRVEANRLRKKLREYYQERGAADPVSIEFPQGSYVPVFRYLTPSLHRQSADPPASPQPRPLDPKTVAVLPFRNLSPDPGQDFLCDGITEEILNSLTTIPELNVVARTSVFHFKGQRDDVREIGVQLGAGTVIEGSVRTSGERLRISARAIDAAQGLLLWAGTFNRGLSDVFAIEDEIAHAVAESLRVTLASSPESASTLRGKPNLEAYTAYLKGRHYWNNVSEQGIQAALNKFTGPIQLYTD